MKQEHIHSPTLNTIKMVENTLENMEDSEITIAGLKRILPKQINHYTLKQILKYLEKSHKILYTAEGIVWIYNNSPKFWAEVRKGTKH